MIYIVCSALLFLYGQLSWSCSSVCALIWILPLILEASFKRLTFIQGFIWGFLVFSFHLSWLLVVLVRFGASFLGIFLWIITILWFSIICGLWFFSTKYSWIGSTLLFFIFLTKLSLLPFGRIEGYPLINPILPFIQFFDQKNFEKNHVGCDTDIALIVPWWYGHLNPMFVGYRMMDSICEKVRNLPNIHTLIMPESTFCFDIEEYSDFFSIWSDGYEHINIVFGAHRKSGDGYLNSIFVVRDGIIQKVYDKQHFMPFFEQNVWNLDLFSQKNQNVTSAYGDDVITLGKQKYQIFMCSELFFEIKKTKNLPVLMLWNDSWLQFEWTKKLALQYIQYFALKRNIYVIHASTLGLTNLK